MAAKKSKGYRQAAQGWKKDAQALGMLGYALADFPLPTLEVEIPRKLAKKALSAWEADDGVFKLRRESRREAEVRHHAAVLALVGCAIQERGTWTKTSVLVDLRPDAIARAIDASDSYPYPGANKTLTPRHPVRLPHECALMRTNIDDPRVEIGYSPQTREYWIQIHSSAAVQTIAWCPFCGDRLPAPLRTEYVEELNKLGLQLFDKTPARLADDSWLHGNPDLAEGEPRASTPASVAATRAGASPAGRVMPI